MLSFSRRMIVRAAQPLMLAGAMALIALGTFSNQAAAQGAVKSVHNDWQVRCDTLPDTQDELVRLDPERDCRRSCRCRAHRHCCENHRSQIQSHARGRAGGGTATLGPWTQDRPNRRRAGRIRALPAEWLRCRGGNG